jgi:hypothetical protein
MGETSRTSGKWSQPGVPHKGWTCVYIEDLGELAAVCEMCETQDIRYVHYMEHADYSEKLGCGCICAGRMEEDYERARSREKGLRNAAGRRRRWLSRAWRVSAKGNPYLNATGYNVVVYALSSTTWGFRIKNRGTDAGVTSRRAYPSENAAKLGAFDGMLWLRERGRPP